MKAQNYAGIEDEMNVEPGYIMGTFVPIEDPCVENCLACSVEGSERNGGGDSLK